MNGKSARTRRVGWTLVLVGLAGGMNVGCKDSGLPDRNLPKAEAERRTYEYPAYQMAASRPEVWDLDGRRWVAGATIETIDAALLRSVAIANGTPIFALSWDREPFDRLYTPVGENRWRLVETVD